MENELKMWAAINSKEIPQEKFMETYGVSFDNFFKAHKKECMAEWRAYSKVQAQIKRTDKRLSREKETKKGCICSKEEKLPWNADNNGLRRRLWKCPVHGNTFCFKEQVQL